MYRGAIIHYYITYNTPMSHPYRSQFPTVGPRMIEKLTIIGVHTREELAQL